MKKIARLRIGAEHAVKLIRGEKVKIKVPDGTQVLQLELATPPYSADATYSSYVGGYSDYVGELVDLFFNGRPTRK